MYELSLTCHVVFGEYSVEKIPGLIKTHIKNDPVRRLFLVTSEIMEWNAPVVERIGSILSKGGFETAVFDGIKPNPTLGNINRGKRKYAGLGCDAVIALGGGSPIDAAKIIAHACRAAALIVVPTTAGTGSEVSGWSVISDSENLKKLSLYTRAPDIVVMDPLLTVTMSPTLTFFTAIDAISHALESYLSSSANCFSDSLAFKSIRLTAQHLAAAVKNGNDMTARTGLLEASLLSGTAMMSAGLGVGHAVANTIGGIYHDSVHGWLIAQLLEHVWHFNREHVADKIEDIDSAVQHIFSQIGKLSRQLNLNKDVLETQHFDMIVENSMENVNMATNPRSVATDELKDLLTRCFKWS